MDCTEAENLFVPHIMGELAPDSGQRCELEGHLACCRACCEEYESNKWAVGFIEAHKAEFADALEAAENKAVSQQELERSWHGIEAKLDKLEAQEKCEKRGKIRRILVKVSVAAACLAIGAFAWLMLPDSTPPQEPIAHRGASFPAPSIKIALLSEAGRVAVAAGQEVSTSAGQFKTLTINDRHRLVLNAETEVSIEPLSENKRLGCLVKLASGQIYVHVQHDGDPFVVATAHGRAVITGTTFDVKAAGTGTTLVVAEGSVKFESRKGVVEVASGQISEIIANSAPTRPQSCNTAELTAWATGHELKTALAKIQPYSDDYDLTDLWLTANSGPIELESINYENWIEEQRPWFEREFPWTAQLQSALAAEGIEVDYPELLISSGDIWQFVYPETSPRQIPIPYLDPMLKAASKYGFDEQWLTANIRAARFAIDDPAAVKGRFTGSRAFEAWATCFEKLPDSHTLLYSIHAGAYLANTRTLAGLSPMNGNIDLPPDDKAKVLALLQTEVNTAYELGGRVMRLFVASEDQPCDECQALLDSIVERISTIRGVEKAISAYKTGGRKEVIPMGR
jgi:ferric-dicitrate binding protein FerR (iron transport regulator)